jgi:hypothetical protein
MLITHRQSALKPEEADSGAIDGSAHPLRVLVEAEGSTDMADSDGDSDEARTFRPLQAAACTYRIAFGPHAGHKVLTVQGAMPRQTEFKQTLCADINGNSVARSRALRGACISTQE